MEEDSEELEREIEEDEEADAAAQARRRGIRLESPGAWVKRRVEIPLRAVFPWRMRLRTRRR